MPETIPQTASELRRALAALAGEAGPDHRVAAIAVIVSDLGSDLATWHARGDGPEPVARRAASRAMDAIDALLAELHATRADLVREIRVSDDEAGKRADALLAKLAGGAL